MHKRVLLCSHHAGHGDGFSSEIEGKTKPSVVEELSNSCSESETEIESEVQPVAISLLDHLKSDINQIGKGKSKAEARHEQSGNVTITTLYSVLLCLHYAKCFWLLLFTKA